MLITNHFLRKTKQAELLRKRRELGERQSRLDEARRALRSWRSEGERAQEDREDLLELAARVNELAEECDALEREIQAFDELKGAQVFQVNSLADIPRVLIEARISRDLTQAQLAEKVDLTKGAIQKYEKNHYESASLATIIRIANVLGIEFQDSSGRLLLLPDVALEPGVEVSWVSCLRLLRMKMVDEAYSLAKQLAETRVEPSHNYTLNFQDALQSFMELREFGKVQKLMRIRSATLESRTPIYPEFDRRSRFGEDLQNFISGFNLEEERHIRTKLQESLAKIAEGMGAARALYILDGDPLEEIAHNGGVSSQTRRLALSVLSTGRPLRPVKTADGAYTVAAYPVRRDAFAMQPANRRAMTENTILGVVALEAPNLSSAHLEDLKIRSLYLLPESVTHADGNAFFKDRSDRRNFLLWTYRWEGKGWGIADNLKSLCLEFSKIVQKNFDARISLTVWDYHLDRLDESYALPKRSSSSNSASGRSSRSFVHGYATVRATTGIDMEYIERKRMPMADTFLAEVAKIKEGEVLRWNGVSRLALDADKPKVMGIKGAIGIPIFPRDPSSNRCTSIITIYHHDEETELPDELLKYFAMVVRDSMHLFEELYPKVGAAHLRARLYNTRDFAPAKVLTVLRDFLTDTFNITGCSIFLYHGDDNRENPWDELEGELRCEFSSGITRPGMTALVAPSSLKYKMSENDSITVRCAKRAFESGGTLAMFVNFVDRVPLKGHFMEGFVPGVEPKGRFLGVGFCDHNAKPMGLIRLTRSEISRPFNRFHISALESLADAACPILVRCRDWDLERSRQVVYQPVSVKQILAWSQRTTHQITRDNLKRLRVTQDNVEETWRNLASATVGFGTRSARIRIIQKCLSFLLQCNSVYLKEVQSECSSPAYGTPDQACRTFYSYGGEEIARDAESRIPSLEAHEEQKAGVWLTEVRGPADRGAPPGIVASIQIPFTVWGDHSEKSHWILGADFNGNDDWFLRCLVMLLVSKKLSVCIGPYLLSRHLEGSKADCKSFLEVLLAYCVHVHRASSGSIHFVASDQKTKRLCSYRDDRDFIYNPPPKDQWGSPIETSSHGWEIPLLIGPFLFVVVRLNHCGIGGLPKMDMVDSIWIDFLELLSGEELQSMFSIKESKTHSYITGPKMTPTIANADCIELTEDRIREIVQRRPLESEM